MPLFLVLAILRLGHLVPLHPDIYIFPLEPDQAPDLVVGDLLDPGVEGLGLDAEVNGKLMDIKKTIR